MLLMNVWAMKILGLLNVGEHTSKNCKLITVSYSDSISRNTFISQLRDSLASATHSGFTVQVATYLGKRAKAEKVRKVLVY